MERYKYFAIANDVKDSCIINTDKSEFRPGDFIYYYKKKPCKRYNLFPESKSDLERELNGYRDKSHLKIVKFDEVLNKIVIYAYKIGNTVYQDSTWSSGSNPESKSDLINDYMPKGAKFLKQVTIYTKNAATDEAKKSLWKFNDELKSKYGSQYELVYYGY